MFYIILEELRIKVHTSAPLSSHTLFTWDPAECITCVWGALPLCPQVIRIGHLTTGHVNVTRGLAF